MRNGLVVVELAMALVLLVPAVLLIKASVRLQHADLGFNPVGAYSFSTALDGRTYDDSTSVVAFHEQLERRLGAVPGVEAVGVGSGLPLWGQYGGLVTILGTESGDSGAASPAPLSYQISPGYLDAAGIRLVKGRSITPSDRLGAPRVMLINESFSRRHWPNADPIGRRVRFRQNEFEIVGVVADLLAGGADQPPHDLAFVALGQSPPLAAFYVGGGRLDPVALTAQVRAVVNDLAPGQPVTVVQPLTDHARVARRDYEIMTQLLSVLGATALLLAMVGVYGVVSYSVAQRVQELSIRRALGAQSHDVLSLLFRHTAKLVGIGSVVGAALALGMGRALSGLFAAVSSFDIVVFLGVPFGLMLAAAVATVVPARRATRVDAMLTLRSD
jgi:predicted permease